MNYTLIDLADIECSESSLFLEGAILAANMSVKPMAIEQWLSSLTENTSQELVGVIEGQFHHQYACLMANQYSALSLVTWNEESESLSDFAEGFMSIWPIVESDWQQEQISDGSLRMLQALLTTMMLAIDEEHTQQQMKEAGIGEPPRLSEMVENLDLMIHEVANAANEQQLGAKAQSVNPFKSVGRNDSCPCGSGKKYKQCCLTHS